MNKKIVFFVIALITIASLFFNTYKKSSLPGFNADEAAFGYNAYSLSTNARDEHGAFLPLRLKSFGDYKLPLYSYLSIPFIKTMGLNENSTRILNTVIALLFPAAVYLLAKELFKKDDIALTAAGISAISLGLHIFSRQAHEAYLAAFLLTLTTLFFVKLLNKFSLKSLVFFSLFLVLSLFSYHSSRLFAAFYFIYGLFHFFIKEKKQAWKFAVFIGAVIGIFLLTDILYKPERVESLLFFNRSGFSMKIQEMRQEGSSRITHNKLTFAVKDILYEHLKYLSPHFLVIIGDENPRFGFPEMSPITALEYIFLLIGLFFLFNKKERMRYLLLILLIVAPFSGSLSWATGSLSRTLFYLIPIILISSYGGYYFIKSFRKKNHMLSILLALLLIEASLLYYSWDFYINHYPKRAVVVRAWQAGYDELEKYIEKNYDKFDNFYITDRNGQPYIFSLFYLKYSPESYQKQADLTEPDQYGFGKIKKFDKFIFNFRDPKLVKNSVIIGFPDDFTSMKDYKTAINSDKLEKIKVGTEEMFWIYEKPR